MVQKRLAAILATVQVALLVYAGWAAGLSPIYFIFACGGTAFALGIMIAEVDFSSCAWFFLRGFWYVGRKIVMGFAGEYVARYYNLETTTGNAS